MAVNITSDLQLISDCDSITGWSSASSSFGVNVDVFLQGVGCLGDVVGSSQSGGLSDLAVYDILATTGSTVDATNKAFFIWMMSSLKIQSIALGGFRFYIEDINGNYAIYYIAGYENYFGGWSCFVIDPTQSPNEGSIVDYTQVAKIGVQWYTASPKTGSAQNCFVDAIYLGSYITVTVDDYTVDTCDFDTIFTYCDDVSRKWGIITKSGDVYFLRGSINFGDGVNQCNFSDKSQILVYDDNAIVSDTFLKMSVRGNADNTVKVLLGEEVITDSGSIGINGVVIKSKTKSVDLLFDDVNSNISILGCSFIGLNSLYLNGSVKNTLFSQCNEVYPGSNCYFTNNIISSSASTTGALKMPLTNNISSCQFFGNYIGVEVGEVGEYNFNNLYFSGNTYDINNTSGSEVTINIINGGNASSYTGSLVIINNLVTLTLTGIKLGSEVRIFDATTMEELAGVESITSDTFVYSYNYTGDKDVIIVVFHLDYIPIRFTYTLSSQNSVLPINQTIDRVYYNP